MPSPSSASISRSIARQIRRSRRPITILFTDVVDSTRYWDLHGDTIGRLMIDKHNRLISTVIERYHGKIIKHIGDSIMASFNTPASALKASIGVQQILEKQRNEDENFRIKVRIGVHTGKALVEDKDVFGDTVNLAARVQGRAKGNEIYISNDTASLLNKAAFGLVEAGKFIPKGKKNEVALYTCEWQNRPSLIGGIKQNPFMQVVRRQKLEFLTYSVAGLGILYFLFVKYLRYLLVDKEPLALLTLKLQLLLDSRIAIAGGFTAVALIWAYLALRTRTTPHITLSFLKAGFGFAVGFLLFFLPSYYLHLLAGPTWNKTLYCSHHLFVEVLEDDTSAHLSPSEISEAILSAPKGTIFLLADVVKKAGITWNKVLVSEREYGWIPRVVPAKMGVPEKRCSIANKFYFKYRDLGALVAGMLGFLWGLLSFRIRPL